MSVAPWFVPTCVLESPYFAAVGILVPTGVVISCQVDRRVVRSWEAIGRQTTTLGRPLGTSSLGYEE